MTTTSIRTARPLMGRVTLATVTRIVVATLFGWLILALATRNAGAQSSEGEVAYFDSSTVAAAFAKGSVLLVRENYMIHTSRRDDAGQGEVHTRDADVIHVLSGSATFVTGGTLVDPKPIAPDEIRGSAVAGGTTREIRPGDVIVVPRGVPHWFKVVRGPLFYYVVKVR